MNLFVDAFLSSSGRRSRASITGKPAFSRDPAVKSAIEIASCASLNRDQIAAIARRLFTRRGFYVETERDWANAFYTYVVSSRAWTELEGKAARSGAESDIDALAAARTLLGRLIAQSADVLGIDRAQLDELCARRLINCDDFLRQLPRLPEQSVDAQRPARQRRRFLGDLNEQLKALGLDLDLGGEVPPPTLP